MANDSDTDRAYMLVHQCRRINSPSLIVTTHMGQLFPTVYSTPDEADPITGKLHSTQLLFDRVLCDVPCSGMQLITELWCVVNCLDSRFRRWNFTQESRNMEQVEHVFFDDFTPSAAFDCAAWLATAEGRRPHGLQYVFYVSIR